jgi:hypothetical protein
MDPIKKGDKDHKGSSYNFLIKWKDGSKSYEPLENIAANDLITSSYMLR